MSQVTLYLDEETGEPPARPALVRKAGGAGGPGRLCELRAKLLTPIAGGENEHTLYGFRDLRGRNAVDIVQPDLGPCGGISAARHITALAHAHGIEVNPLLWGSAVAQAASPQVIAALPVTHHAVIARDPVLECDRSSHPFRRELVTHLLDMSEGLVAARDTPGLGIEVRRDALERDRINRALRGPEVLGAMCVLKAPGGVGRVVLDSPALPMARRRPDA